MDADGDVQNEDWWANELPADLQDDMVQKIPQTIRRQARKAHVGLGHPSPKTFLRMLQPGSASPAILEYSRAWQCPVCAESVRPGRLQETPSRGRPGKVVCIDLKYLHDADKAHHVALSMVDAGTLWHCVALLRNRKQETGSSSKVVKEENIVGREKAKLTLAVCVKATSATMTRAGLTPEQAVFGKGLRWL